MSDLRYPIGKYSQTGTVTESQISNWIDDIAALPEQMRAAVAGLNEAQLDTPYRPDGWTVRQVVHHVPESHMNSYIRFKWTLTEDQPTIKPYFEERWAELADARSAPIEPSLRLLESLHARWVLALKAMSPEDWTRRLIHPEMGTIELGWIAGLYAWHGKHHVAHVTSLRAREGW